MKRTASSPFCLPLVFAFSSLVALSFSAEWEDGASANAVIGQADYTSSDEGASIWSLNSPASVSVHHESGKVFVSDRGNHRVLRFSSVVAMSEGAGAETVFGQSNFSGNTPDNSQSGLYDPHGICVDAEGRLWVAEYSNSRVVCYEDAVDTSVMGKAASLVLGQPDFVTITPGTDNRTMDRPQHVNVDHFGNLWVADTANHRVLMYSDAKNKQNGDPADKVLGQSNFMTGSSGLGVDRMNLPMGIATRPKFYNLGGMIPLIVFGVELWVTDYTNNRVLRFDHATAKPDGGDADGVLGQDLFTTDASDVTAEAFYLPIGLALSSSGELWLADTNNHRVLRFDSAGEKPNGSPADNVIGQDDFESDSRRLTRSGMGFPVGVAVDGDGNLFVSSMADNRVLRFSPSSPPAGTVDPDLLVGDSANPAKQRGDGIKNPAGAGQKINIKKKGKSATAHFTAQNDGGAAGSFLFQAKRGSKKVGVKIFSFAGGSRSNVTGQIVSGNFGADLGAKQSVRFLAKVKSRTGSKARHALKMTVGAGGKFDAALAKIILKPKK